MIGKYMNQNLKKVIYSVKQMIVVMMDKIIK
jgi:hypothetical protein